MFSSHHSHDAMRRLLKAAVGVPLKADVSDPANRRRSAKIRTAPKGTPAISPVDGKDVFRT
jgi:hypothetical protein